MQLPEHLPRWLKNAAATLFHLDLRPLALRDTLPDQSPPVDSDAADVLRAQATQRAHRMPGSFRE